MRWSDPVLTGWLALHFVVALTGTWLARHYALQRGLIDEPGIRRSHATPTPRGGGIAIVFALLLALGWLTLVAFANAPPADANADGDSGVARIGLYAAIAMGLSLVAGIGWLDDHRPLSPWLRLSTHGLAAAILAWGIHSAGGDTFATASSFVLALVLTNIWNFMDGIDGLVASQAGLVAIGYALLAGHGSVGWLAAAVVAACAGFLPFNLPTARIFLGDVGSGALGFALASVAGLLLSLDAAALPLVMLPLSACCIDATLTLTSRMVRRETWWEPHTQHAYQRWVRVSGRHGPVTLGYAIWTVITVSLMLGVSESSSTVIMGALGATSLAGGATWWCLQRMAKIGGSDTRSE